MDETDRHEDERRRAVSGAPQFVCPACRSSLEYHAAPAERYTCIACARRYPVVIGIADFRLCPDPWIDLEADRAKGIALETDTAEADFETTVRTYWERTPDTPRALAERFTRFVVEAEPRAGEWLSRVLPNAPATGWWLDVGCGTGDMVLAGARRGLSMVGIDIAFRWLVVARRRLQRAGYSAPLVCCNAEHLPFAAGSFERVVSLGTLEHCLDAGRTLEEAARVLRPGGALHLRTVNRYSLLAEPHVGVWGVGFVPRRWADRYVRWRSGQRYEHHRPLSPREVRRALAAAGFASVRVAPAALLAADRARAGPLANVAPFYEVVRRVPAFARVMSWGVPLLEADGSIDGRSERGT